MNDQEIQRLAKKRVQEKKVFFTHIILYFIGIGSLFLINYNLIHTHRPWFLTPAIFWGIGLMIHGAIFYYNRRLKHGSNWEEKELEKEIQRLKELRDLRSDKYENQNLFDDNLELKDIEPLRKEWEDEDLV